MTIATAVPGTIDVHRPDTVGALTVFPIITDTGPREPYVSLTNGIEDGVTVRELPGRASVGDLEVCNPLDRPVLLYEGEEVRGAQQNRTFDVSVLVPPKSSLPVPVSCVEAGRWDGRRHAEAFQPAPQAAYPELRRIKNRRVREQLELAAEPRAHQGEVWDEIAAKLVDHDTVSETGAMHDVFESRREALDVTGVIKMYCSQVGMLVAIGGRFVVLDYVSDPDALDGIHRPLVQGYALDALDQPPVPPPSQEDARDFVAQLLRATPVASPAVGLGDQLRFEFSTLAGTGLRHDGELVALTAFAA